MRRIFKIQHSYISRVTNHDVGVKSNSIDLSLQLMKHQIMLYGLITSLHAEHVLRKSTLNADFPTPPSIQGKRLRGRPRAQWGNCVFSHVMHVSKASSISCAHAPQTIRRFTFVNISNVCTRAIFIDPTPFA